MGRTFENLKEALKGNKTFKSLDVDLLIEVANDEGKKVEEKAVKNNQIRKFYDVIKNIERKCINLKDNDKLSEDIKAQLLFLKPHLANAAKKKAEMARIKEVMDFCIDSKYIDTKADLKKFVRFFESIIAYSK